MFSPPCIEQSRGNGFGWKVQHFLRGLNMTLRPIRPGGGQDSGSILGLEVRIDLY